MKNILPLLLLILVSYAAAAQSPYFEQYFLLKRNEPVQINSIFQDDEGFIWFGTNKGLFQYDGKKYSRYNRTDSLPDENVTALAQDSAGRIWTGHRNGKIAFIENGAIHTFEPPEGSSSAEISDILFDRKGNLWFATLNDGLYYYTHERLYRLDEQEGMPDLYIYDILEDHRGNIWAGTDGGIAICTLNADKVKINVLNNADGLPDNIVKKFVADRNVVWIATEDAGIIGYDFATQKFNPLLNVSWPYGSISDFTLKDDKFWIASAQSGLFVFDKNNFAVKHFNTSSEGLSSIYAILKDEEGNIWAGSKTGIVRTPGDHLEFIESMEPAGANVIAVTRDSQGCIWFSTDEGLFRRCVDSKGSPTVQKQLTNTAFSKYRIISLFTDDAGYIWAGLYGEGVLRINPVTGKIRHLNKELRNGNVLNITGKGNVVWLATLGGGEMITLADETLTIKNYSTENGLSSDFIYQVFLDSDGNVWFATDGKGVDKLDKSGFHHFDSGLTSKVVYGFAEDSRKNIWINVQGNGIYKFNDGGFQPLSTNIALRDNNINCMAADPLGHILVMHDLGIDIYNVETNKIRYLGEETGIRNKKATLNALSKDDAGNFLIGTDGGIIQFTPDKKVTLNVPKVTINGLRVFDQKVNNEKAGDLSYDENSVTIDFLGFWYQDPKSLHFLYKMDNYDLDWISTGDNEVTYSRLPPGNYTFRVKASDTEDFTNAQEASVNFRIQPPFWKTIPFYLGSGLLITFLAYSFLQYRENKLRQDKIILEAKVEERTMEIQRKTEEIQAQNEEITAQAEEIKGINDNLELLVAERTAELEKKNKALEEYAFINAHKLRSPVASILGLIHLMGKTELNDEAKVISKHLQQSADELDDVVRSITKAIERGEK